MTSLLQFVPPNLTLIPPGTRARPSPPAFSSTAVSTRASTIVVAVATTKTKDEDDYRATLEALKSRGRFPRKSLGQHYMLNSAINEQLAIAGKVKEGDVVLEIGPGTGALTNVLVNAGATVLGIEKDPHMAALVTERFASSDRVKVLQEDFTKCHFRSHVLSLLECENTLDGDSQQAKVVANIPFNISTDVIKLLLPMGDLFSEVVLLLQVSSSSSKAYMASASSSSEGPPNHCYLDSVSTSHVTNNLENMHTYRPYLGSYQVLVRNGSTLPIQRTGKGHSTHREGHCTHSHWTNLLRKLHVRAITLRASISFPASQIL